MISENEVERLLFNWSYWVKSGERIYKKLWYPKNIIEGISKIGFFIPASKFQSDSNPEAEKIDQIMLHLMNFNEEWFKSVFVRFMCPTKSKDEMAVIVGCGKTFFMKKLYAGIGWVSGSLNEMSVCTSKKLNLVNLVSLAKS